MQLQITVGMPVYNERKYITETLDSLLSQTYENFEVVISDNNSQDGTYEILQQYAKKDKRIKLFKQPKNIGSLKNFRFVLEQAQTPYFIWLAGHDIWHQKLLEKLLKAFTDSKDENIILTFPKFQIIGTEISYGYEGTEKLDDPIQRYIFGFNVICDIIYGLWKTDILKKLRIRYIFAPDRFLLLQASLLGKFKSVDEVLFFRRDTGGALPLQDAIAYKIRTVEGKEKLSKIISNKKIKYLVYPVFLMREGANTLKEYLLFIKDAEKFGVNLSLQQKIYLSFQTIFSIFERFIKIQYFSLKGKINLQFLVQENLERIKEAKKKIEKMGNKIS